MDQEKVLLQEYARARSEYEKADFELKRAKNNKDIKEQLLVSLLTQKGAIQTSKFEGIGFAKLRKMEVKTANYPKDKEEDFFGFVRSSGHPDIIKLNIHPTTLRSFLKGCLEEGSDVPDYVFYETRQGLTYYDRSK